MTDKKPRTDKRKNVGKVAEVLAKNPNKTVREIAKETDLWTWTVQRAKEEVEQSGTKDPTIAYIVWASKDNLKDFMKLYRAKVKQMVKENIEEDENGEVKMKEKSYINSKELEIISKMAKDDMARITVLWWDATDESGWLKQAQVVLLPWLNE